MAGPLTGIKVLDLSRVLAGPWAGQMLADLGADVIKIERPGSGDDTRGWGPPYLPDARGAPTTESAYYLSANRGKRSVAIDLNHPRGAALVRDLAADSDVVLENFKVGGLRRFGLDADTLTELNPRLVYCSITGFGQTGPYRERPGYDFMIQGMAGLMSVTGRSDHEVGGDPQKAGVAVSDVLTGLHAVIAVLAALHERRSSGLGQVIDLALLDVQVACMANQASSYLVSGRPPGRLGNAHPSIVPYQTFACADGYLILAVGNDAQFRRLCTLLAVPQLAADERFATNAARVAHRDLLVAELAPVFKQQPAAWWLENLEAAAIPCGPINDLGQVFEDPQVRARGLRIELPHPLAGRAPGVASPLRFSRTPVRHERAPPTLGQHTREVLRERLGLGPDGFGELLEAGVVQGD